MGASQPLAMHTFILNGHVIVSPNMSVPPSAVCLPTLKSDNEGEALSSGHKFYIMSLDYPQLPFSLCHIPCHGPLFSCLAFSKQSLLIVQVHSLYQLRSDLLDKWIALDDFLTNVFHILGMFAPMNVVLTLVSKVTNYRKPQETEKATHSATSHALHLFQEACKTTNETAVRSECSQHSGTGEERGDGLSVGASQGLSTLHQHRSLNGKPNLGIIPRQSEAL